RRFWRPFLLIQGAAVALVIAYHASAGVRAACAAAAAWKARGGLLFAAIIGSIAGAVLPELATLIADRGARRSRGGAAALLFQLAFFAVNGVLVDRLYRFEARLFGSEASPGT